MTQQEINNQTMLRVGTILRGIYRIDSYLSSGGFGNTYIATNIEFEERVAIKEFFMKGVNQREDNQTTVNVSNSENKDSFLAQREKFKKEARRIRQLRNKHIVNVHDLFEENGTAYYVMDYVDGENLSERLKRTGKPLSEVEVRLILPQILDALKSVHDAGIWHLDLKPANIMLDKSGCVKLIDFGASKQMDTNKGGATTSTAISYTNGYAPREQMEQNYDKFGPWTDIYSLGATLYNLLTNKRPPLPTDIDDDITADKHEALPFPDDVSFETKSLVLMMLNTNRLKRPQSVNSIINAEKGKKVSSQMTSNQQTIEQNTASHYDEETVIGSLPNEETIIEQPPKARRKVKPEPSRSPQRTNESSFFTNDVEKKSNFWNYWWIVFIGCLFFLLLYVRYNSGLQPADESPQAQEEIPLIKEVNRMQYMTAKGSCMYSGPVDENNNPDGIGQAYFDDGRYYKGGFEHGEMIGDDCYFRYDNGDEFKGKFRNNSFYYGTYTLAADKSYFVGDYTNGQPSCGKWYDKDGNLLEVIE